MARIHGNWCGPNWTGGKALPANSPKVNWNAKCVDKLDCACKKHDRDCSHSLGCSAKADRALINTAFWVGLTSFDPITRTKAKAIQAAITAASMTRKR